MAKKTTIEISAQLVPEVLEMFRAHADRLRLWAKDIEEELEDASVQWDLHDEVMGIIDDLVRS